MLPLTGLYAAILTLMMIGLAAHVIILRGKSGISLMQGDSLALAERMRRHGNFIETVPVALILMGISELQGLSSFWLHAMGGALVAGRAIHPFGIHHDQPANPARIIGFVLTMVAMLVAVAWILWRSFAA
ncbi:MAG: MAPEG family protein [Pseudomonadota bacterium]